MFYQFTQKLQAKLFKQLKSQMDHLILNMDEQLQHLSKTENLPSEIEEIKALIKQAANEHDQQQYLKHLGEITTKITAINDKYIFDNAALNNYFFLAQRALTRMSALVSSSKNLKYLDLVLNPREMSEETVDAVPSGSRGIAGRVLYGIGGAVKKALPFNLPDVTLGAVSKGSDLIAYETTHLTIAAIKDTLNVGIPEGIERVEIMDKTGELNPLKKLLGVNKYQELQSELPVSDLESVDKYANEQIYGILFETVFVQMAMLKDILDKVQEIYKDEQDSELRHKYISDALAKIGLKSLGDKSTLSMLDKISIRLGYESINTLHECYSKIKLNQQDALYNLKDKKAAFVKQAHVDDPKTNTYDLMLQRLYKACAKYEAKVTDKEFSQDNGALISLMLHLGSDFPASLNAAFVAKAVAREGMKTYVSPEQENRFGAVIGNIVDFGLQWASPSYIDTALFYGVNANNAKILPMVQYTHDVVNDQWIDIRITHIASQISERTAVFDGKYNEKSATSTLVAMMLEQHAQVTGRNRSGNSVSESSVQKLADYKDWLQFSRKVSMIRMSTNALKKDVKETTDKITATRAAVSRLRLDIEDIDRRIDAYKKQERQSWNPLTRFQGLMKSVGIKSIAIRTREHKIKDLLKKRKDNYNTIKQLQSESIADYSYKIALNSVLSYRERIGAASGDELVSCFQESSLLMRQSYNSMMESLNNPDEALGNQPFVHLQNKFLDNYYKNREVMETIKLHIDELSLSSMQVLENLVNAHATVVKKFDPSISGLANHLSGYQAELSDLSRLVNENINAELMKSQKNEFQQYEQDIELYFDTRTAEELLDPFEIFKGETDSHFKSLVPEYQNILIQDVISKYLDKINNSKSLEVYQLELLHENLYTNIGSSDLVFSDHYESLEKELRAQLQVKYQDQPIDAKAYFLRRKLHRLNQLQRDYTSTSELQASWLYNPFGQITVERVAEIQRTIDVNKQQFVLQLASYKDDLEHRLRRAKETQVTETEEPELTNFMETLLDAYHDSEYTFSKELIPVIDEVIGLYERLGELDQVSKTQHLHFKYMQPVESKNWLSILNGLSRDLRPYPNQTGDRFANVFEQIASMVDPEQETEMPDFQKGFIQAWFIDKDAHYLNNLRLTYMLMENVVSDLTQRAKNFEVGDDPSSESARNDFFKSQTQCIDQVNQIVKELTVHCSDNVENSERFESSTKPWSTNLHTLIDRQADALHALRPDTQPRIQANF